MSSKASYIVEWSGGGGGGSEDASAFWNLKWSDVFFFVSAIKTSDMKHINTLCGQNVEFVNVKPGGTCSNHWALEGDSVRTAQ
jgi:hypothetical protein